MKIKPYIPVSLSQGKCRFIVFGLFCLVSVGTGWQFFDCLFGRCCDGTWKPSYFTILEEELEKSLHGQHIAKRTFLRHLKSHFLDAKPKKALVLSLHGMTGSGKNFVTSLALGIILSQGEKSQYSKVWTAKHHFSDENKLEQYKTEVQKSIRDMVTNCPRSIFVFDETNELPSGLLDVLKPMMDEYEELDGVDYRKATFLFLSNTGATKINKIVKEAKIGKIKRDRSKLELQDFQGLIQDGAFNEKGGLLRCHLITKNLIDAYIPFLPMEKEHIKLCIRDFLTNKKCPIQDSFVEKIANMVNYEHGLFASYGCRGVDSFIKQEIENDECLYGPKQAPKRWHWWWEL